MTDAGWYPDPEAKATQRYWDGAAWTEHRAPGRSSNSDTIVALLVGIVFVIGVIVVLSLAL